MMATYIINKKQSDAKKNPRFLVTTVAGFIKYLEITQITTAKYTVINEYWTMELMAYMLEVLLVLDHASIDSFMQNPITGKHVKK